LPALSTPTSVPRSELVAVPTASRALEAGATPLTLYGLEFSLDTASLDALEAVARSVTPTQLAAWFAQFEGTEEVALLSTCHRIELTLLVRSSAEVGRWREALPGDRASWALREGREAVRHLFRVASGRESLAVGEAEVRQQVRAAARLIQSRHPRPVLHELFAAAAAAAEEVGSPVTLAPSIAAIAARRLLKLVDRPQPRVLVVGSGTVGRQVTERLATFARVLVVFHEHPPEEAFLLATGAQSAPLDQLSRELVHADAVVTAAKFGNRGLRPSDLPHDHPLVLVDLGMPRNIDPSVRDLPNVRLVDLEELHARPERTVSSDAPEARIDALADHFTDRLEATLWQPWIDAFRRAAERIRRLELSIARPFLGGLDPEQETAVERLTLRLVARLLAAPTERLRSLPPGPEGDLLRRLALDLLRPDLDDP
jgi:glutamyl-tRNA reductase